MRITSMELLPNGGGEGNLARFNLEFETGVRIYKMTLRRNADGKFRTFAPNARGTGDRVVTFSLEMARTITDAASAAYETLGRQHAA